LSIEKDPERRERYLERSCESVAKITFHSLAFFWGLIVLKNESWLPWVFGGDMSLKELLTDVLVKTIPFGSPSKAVVDYGLYCAGYHYTELIRHALFS
jgi:hypothetical protein